MSYEQEPGSLQPVSYHVVEGDFEQDEQKYVVPKRPEFTLDDSTMQRFHEEYDEVLPQLPEWRSLYFLFMTMGSCIRTSTAHYIQEVWSDPVRKDNVYHHVYYPPLYQCSNQTACCQTDDPNGLVQWLEINFPTCSVSLESTGDTLPWSVTVRRSQSFPVPPFPVQSSVPDHSFQLLVRGGIVFFKLQRIFNQTLPVTTMLQSAKYLLGRTPKTASVKEVLINDSTVLTEESFVEMVLPFLNNVILKQRLQQFSPVYISVDHVNHPAFRQERDLILTVFSRSFEMRNWKNLNVVATPYQPKAPRQKQKDFERDFEILRRTGVIPAPMFTPQRIHQGRQERQRNSAFQRLKSAYRYSNEVDDQIARTINGAGIWVYDHLGLVHVKPALANVCEYFQQTGRRLNEWDARMSGWTKQKLKSAGYGILRGLNHLRGSGSPPS
jgi:hypothetical protein